MSCTQEGPTLRVWDFENLGVWSAKMQAPIKVEGQSHVAGFLGFRTLEDMRVEKRAFNVRASERRTLKSLKPICRWRANLIHWI
jgi:hypothetical protein